MAIKVTQRQKPISCNWQSLYLDSYPAIPHPATGKLTRREFLNLYVFDRQGNIIDKQHNKEVLQLAKQIFGGTLYQSREVFIYTNSSSWNRLKSLEIGQRKFKVTILSADYVNVDRVAVTHSEYKNGQSGRYNSSISYLFKKEASGWKVIHAHESGSLIR
jgi:hypothetical protein